MVQANAVRRAKELVETVVEAGRLEREVGRNREKLRVLETDHGGAVSKDSRDCQCNDTGDDDRQHVSKLV